MSIQSKNPLSENLHELHNAFNAADNIVLKKYISSLSTALCIEISDELKSLPIGENVSLYKLTKIVYDKNENIQEKLTTVYSTIFSLDHSGIVVLVVGTKTAVDLYIGVVTRSLTGDNLYVDDKKRDDKGKVLSNAFVANFPGTKLEKVRNYKNEYDLGKEDIIKDCFDDIKYVASVSSIPTARKNNETKNQEFVQGLEKLIDTLRGKEYTALIIADAMNNQRIEEMCAEYEDLYSQLAPFKASSQTISSQKGTTDTESLIKGITDTTNETIAKSLTHSTASSKTHTDSVGGSVGVDKVVKVSATYNHSYSRTKTEGQATTDTKSTGTAKSLTEQNSVAKALSKTDGEAIQINHENRAVKTLLDRIDEQIKRMRSCEDFGMFDTCAYFASKEYDVAIAAASVFKSLTRGENSSVESSAVNVWKKQEEVSKIKEYLMRFYHPEFLTVLNEADNENDNTHVYPTTPAMLISGREMAYQMPMPKKSVSGVAIVECTEFARETVLLDNAKGNDFQGKVSLGNIYHMHREEPTPVKLNVKNLTAHTFITGSTGSGKSTTIYKLLDELSSVNVDETDETVKFMVIEPAKGEYKDALAKNKKFNIKVYGTNPNFTQLLRLNPFSFPCEKVHIYEHLERLVEIFNVCWPMYAAMPAVLKAAIENAYKNAGWNLIKSENPYGKIFPSFIDVAVEVERYINRSEYSDENKSNYKGSLLTRLESLTNGINRLIFSADEIVDKDLFDENVIVDLSRIGSVETKALIMGILILKLQEYRIATTNKPNAPLKHITVLEEAHNLLKRTSTEQSSESANLLGKSVEMLANAIAEMRTAGEGFIIADQSPGLLDLSVIRNTNTKIIMRLPDYSDRELVGYSAGLNDDQIVELAKLPCGVAAVYQSDWIAPVLCKVEKPKLKDEPYFEQYDYPEETDESVVFDLLDMGFREKLDNKFEEEAFRKLILKSSISTEKKIKLMSFLDNKKTSLSTKILANMLFDYFKNTKDILESTVEQSSIEELRFSIMAELNPSIMDFEDEQIDLLVVLIIKEYYDRYKIDYPIWREFLEKYKEGDVI